MEILDNAAKPYFMALKRFEFYLCLKLILKRFICEFLLVIQRSK